jgi:hypothetical protein
MGVFHGDRMGEQYLMSTTIKTISFGILMVLIVVGIIIYIQLIKTISYYNNIHPTIMGIMWMRVADMCSVSLENGDFTPCDSLDHHWPESGIAMFLHFLLC